MDQPTQETCRKPVEEAEYVMLLQEEGGKPNANIRKRPIENAEAGKAETNKAVVTKDPNRYKPT